METASPVFSRRLASNGIASSEFFATNRRWPVATYRALAPPVMRVRGVPPIGSAMMRASSQRVSADVAIDATP